MGILEKVALKSIVNVLQVVQDRLLLGQNEVSVICKSVGAIK